MQKTISLVIPVYNEEAHLNDFLTLIDALDFSKVLEGHPLEKELVFVNDCSVDRTREIIEAFQFQTQKVKVFHQEVNQGKGAALHRGFVEASGEFIVVQDADFEYDPEDLKELVLPLLKNKAEVVYGSRFKKTVTQVHRTFHYLVNRLLTTLSNGLSGLYLTDMETCYKLFKAEIIQNMQLESNRFGFEPEITAKLARLNIRVHELGISYFPRNYLEGKKITWKDGVAALWHIVYFNVFAHKSTFYKKSMPDRFIAKGRQLL